MASDEHWMTRCLTLAQSARGKTHPNPMVGAVLLDRHGQVVGEGVHAAYGAPHAETVALQQASHRAQGGTLYVNLEPCNHQGKTPPCTAAILAAGVAHVVYGMADPNPAVCGGGHAVLAAHEVHVTAGIMAQACYALNEAFCHAVQTGRPFVVVKQALTMDGRIACRTGHSQWITGEATRRWVHRLRADSDAILSTARTVMADDSRLTVRDIGFDGPMPVRVILDRQARLNPARLALFETASEDAPVWILTRQAHAMTGAYPTLPRSGVEVFPMPDDGEGLVLPAVLDFLGSRRITQVLVEAGGHLVGSLLEAGLVQKAWWVYGPKILADPGAMPAVVGHPRAAMTQAFKPIVRQILPLPPDWAVETSFGGEAFLEEGAMSLDSAVWVGS